MAHHQLSTETAIQFALLAKMLYRNANDKQLIIQEYPGLWDGLESIAEEVICREEVFRKLGLRGDPT